MSKLTRKEKEKQELQQKIFDAATNIVVSEGYDKLSIRKIATAIDYSPTTIYNYFKNKDDILMTIAYETYREVVINVKKELTKMPDASPKDKFISSCHSYIDTMLANPEKFRAIMLSSDISLSDDPQPRDANESQEGKGLIQNILDEGVKTSDFHNVNDHSAELILISLMGLVFNIVSYRVTNQTQISQMTTAYIDLLLNGIGGTANEKK